MSIECRYNSSRAHGEIDQPLKSGDRRQLSQLAFASIASDPLLESLSQTIGLTRTVDRERIVFERIELGHYSKPRGLGEGGQNCGQTCQTRKARELFGVCVREKWC